MKTVICKTCGNKFETRSKDLEICQDCYNAEIEMLDFTTI